MISKISSSVPPGRLLYRRTSTADSSRPKPPNNFPLLLVSVSLISEHLWVSAVKEINKTCFTILQKTSLGGNGRGLYLELQLHIRNMWKHFSGPRSSIKPLKETLMLWKPKVFLLHKMKLHHFQLLSPVFALADFLFCRFEKLMQTLSD